MQGVDTRTSLRKTKRKVPGVTTGQCSDVGPPLLHKTVFWGVMNTAASSGGYLWL